MKSSPAFQFYPSDFLSDEHVVLMTNQELGCYVKLLCYCWREGSIPDDLTKIAKLCGEDGSAMAQLWLSIKPCFSSAKTEPERLVHGRLDLERKKQESHRKERSESGKKGAKKRWGKRSKKDSSAMAEPMAEPMANDSSSSSSSSSDKEKETGCSNEQPGGLPPSSNKVLIQELVKKYRSQPNIPQDNQGDFAFIGRLYNQHGYDEVLLAIERLGDKTSIEEIREPLKYLWGILNNSGIGGKPRKEKGGGGKKPVDWENEPWSL